jgi:hypothetical protein
MNTFRTVMIASAAAIAAACSSTPSKPVAPVAPVTPVAAVAPAIANIAGNWNLAVETPMGVIEAKMSVVQTGKDIKGRIESGMGNVDYVGTVGANDVKFSYSIESLGGPPGSFDYVGTLDGGAMKGKATFANFGEGAWSAKRP